MSAINVLLLCGGGGAEHDVSVRSADFIERALAKSEGFSIVRVEIDKSGQYRTSAGERCELTKSREIRFEDPKLTPWSVDYVIPCIHGFPGETGDIQSYFDLIEMPFFGCGSEASRNCFNKITAKMWFSALGIPNTPYIMLHRLNDESIAQTLEALNNWGCVFVKAASQGSSVGCYKLDRKEDIRKVLTDAFSYAPYVIVEKAIQGRELEVAMYQYKGELFATPPGEVICKKNTFYTYDEKYAANSEAETRVIADNLTEEISEKVRGYAIEAFIGMKLSHLSRIDFFLTRDNEILLNEINTFPGLTPISMFPKMLENNGHTFSDYMTSTIFDQLNQL